MVDPPLQESVSDRQTLLDALVESPEETGQDFNLKNVSFGIVTVVPLSSFILLIIFR